MKKTTIKIPEGYQVPEGTKDGQSFDESVTFKLEGERLCLIAVNGVDLPGYEEEGERAHPDKLPEDNHMAAAYAAAMGQPA